MVQLQFGARVGESPAPLSFEGFVDGISVGTTPRIIEVTPGMHSFKIKVTPYNVIMGGYVIKNWQDQNGNIMGAGDTLQVSIPDTVAPTAAIIAVYNWVPGNPWIITGAVITVIIAIPLVVYLLKRK